MGLRVIGRPIVAYPACVWFTSIGLLEGDLMPGGRGRYPAIVPGIKSKYPVMILTLEIPLSGLCSPPGHGRLTCVAATPAASSPSSPAAMAGS
jgi:hypothetical protein